MDGNSQYRILGNQFKSDDLEMTNLYNVRREILDRLNDVVLRELSLVKKLNLMMNWIISDEGIKHLPLEKLCLCNNSKITDYSLKGMDLKYLDISWNFVITGNGIKHFTQLRTLKLCNNLTIICEDIRYYNLESLDIESHMGNFDTILKTMNIYSLTLSNNIYE
jgi:hypothetical protein